MDRYSAGSQQASSAVDWRVVDQELSRVPAEFKDPKFYALKHVVEILTAEDPRSLVAQVWVCVYVCVCVGGGGGGGQGRAGRGGSGRRLGCVRRVLGA
jgi:hypothetical protein